jgi:hypothetical protein
MMKCKHLGLEVVVNNRSVATTTLIHFPKKWSSIEEAPGILAGALKAAVPGLGSGAATNMTHDVGKDEPRVVVVKIAKTSKQQ